jgi:hypothetical protein
MLDSLFWRSTFIGSTLTGSSVIIASFLDLLPILDFSRISYEISDLIFEMIEGNIFFSFSSINESSISGISGSNSCST